jgi:type VI protein secretion system component Hcp
MGDSKTDLIMKFVLERNDVEAESNLDVSPDDTLMKDFEKGTDYDDYTNFFEIDTFSMSMQLHGDDQSASTLHQHAQSKQPSAQPASGQFARWKSASRDEYKNMRFPLEFEKFTFERVIDSASPVFFQCCCTSRTFDRAVLVKRVSQGESGSVQRPALGYLRIDFSKVLITGIGWDDGDLVKEQCEFICQKMVITYRRQDVSGNVPSGGGATMTWPAARGLDIRGGGRG